jgi:hypothetical protein
LFDRRRQTLLAFVDDAQGMGRITSHCGGAADAQPEHASEAIAIAPSAIRGRNRLERAPGVRTDLL